MTKENISAGPLRLGETDRLATTVQGGESDIVCHLVDLNKTSMHRQHVFVWQLIILCMVNYIYFGC